MALIDTIVEGETVERGPFTLKSNDLPFNLTDYTVELVIRPFRGTDYSDTDGEVRVVADTSGTVYFTPDASDFLARESPYSIRWKVTDSLSTVVYFPNSELPDTIAVGKP